MRDRDYAAAVRLFDKLGKLARSDDRLAKAAGFAHLELGNENQALEFFAASLKNRSAQADVHAALGDIYVRRANQDKALRHLHRAVELAPDVPELQYKLGLALLGFDLWAEALEAMRAAQTLNPQYLKARLGLARVLTELGQLDAAEAELQHAKTLAPENYAVAFRVGKLREKQQRFDVAISSYKEAETQSEHAAPVCEALALAELAIGDPEAALKTFARGLQRTPTDTNLLQHAAELRYEMGDPEAFSHYDEALSKGPSQAVHAHYIGCLITAELKEDADLQLQRFEAEFGKNSTWLSLAIQLHYAQGAYEEMLRLLAKAPTDNHGLMTWKAQALLGTGDAAAAQDLMINLVEAQPRDQFLLALLSTCYRLNNPEAYAELVDYDKLLIRAELSTPPGFGSLSSFNEALRETLQEFHVTQTNPMSQSVVGGTQTPGNILEQPHPVIVALKQTYLDTLSRELGPDFYKNIRDDHPVSVGKGCGIKFDSAWSIWVKEGGYHRTHVHSKGWYSSAYYVSLPAELKRANGQGQEGALAFGRPALDTPQGLEADHVLKPAEGILALFPSYFWHGTLPFKGPDARVTVAFDAVPVP